MPKIGRTHEVIFGNVLAVRTYCDSCRRAALIVKGLLACCGKSVNREPVGQKRECEPCQKRQRPPLKARLRQLAEQNNRCAYCDLEFGSMISRREISLVLVVNWDHCVPYAYGQNNSTTNFVAACQVCNSIKRDMTFPSTDEARAYVIQKRIAKGYL